MYKKLIITFLVLLFSTSIFAQKQLDSWVWPDDHIEDALYLHIDVGPKIGGGFSMATKPVFFDFGLKGGFVYQIGASLNVRVAHHPSIGLRGIGRWGLGIEAFYASRSFNAGDKIMTIKCLEIPVLLQFYITKGFQIQAGLTPVKCLRVSPDYIQTGSVVANVGDMKGDDMMISLGACYKTAFGLSFGLRYNLGMSELAENFHSKTSTAMVMVSYLFPIIK